MDQTEILVQSYLLFFILPLLIAAGFADYLCHRAADISRTSGAREAFIHLLLVIEIGVPLILAVFFEINALILATMIVALVAHEVTGVWDLVYAHRSSREVTPFEQHVHSFLEVLPLMAVSFVVVLNWEQFLALFGLGDATPDFDLSFKRDYWSTWYGIALVVAAFLFSVLPFAEEYRRCLRYAAGREGNGSRRTELRPPPAARGTIE